MGEISEVVDKYLSERPFLMFYIKDDVVNIRALARKICDENGIKNVDAVMMATRRYIENTMKGARFVESFKRIEDVLKKSTYSIHTGYVVGKLKKKMEMSENVFFLKFGNDELIVTDSKNSEGVADLRENMAIIELHHPKEIEQTPGVIAYLYFKFFEKNINIEETFSCLNTTFIVIGKSYVKASIDLLDSLLE